MPGRVKAVVLLSLLLFSFSAFADCSQWTARSSNPFRTTAFDVSVDGDFLWVATGYGVQLIENGSIVSSIPLPGSTRVVRAQGSGIAYAGSGTSLYVLRRDGRTITTFATIDVGGTVNDIEIVTSALFVATTIGIAHFDIFNPLTPIRTTIALPTTSANVLSLASAKNQLYAADGDTTVEIYSVTIPTFPQHIGTMETVRFASAVHATSDEFVFVSDRFGQNTDYFSGSTLLAHLQLGANAFAAAGGRTYFVAGPGRTLREIDVTVTDSIAELYAADFAPTDGTDNVIHAMARVDNTLYVAAGDMGLIRLDTTTLARPYPLVGYSVGPMTSVRTSAGKAWFSSLGGKITQQRIDAAGIALITERAWDAEVGSVVRDVRDNGLLTTSGKNATLWSLVSSTPAQAQNVTFAEAVSNAVKSDTHIVALLQNGTVWTVPNGQTTPTKVNVPVMTLMARSGSAIVLAEVQEEEKKTVLHYYATGDLAATPQRFTIDGAAAGSIALDATRIAVFTFNGISIIELGSGNVRVIADSDRVIPRQLAFSGDDLLVMDARRLLVYDDARTLLRDHALPAETLAIDASAPVAVLATTKGNGAIRYLAELPEAIAPYANTFYTKLAAAPGRAYLVDLEGIDVFSTTTPGRLHYLATVPAAGTIDLAANESSLFTLAGNGTVRAVSRAGVPFAETSIREGFDSQPVAIRTAGNAVWASIAVGCTLQGCRERKTVVLDPNTLAVTATLTGSITDVTVVGTRAYALFAFPDEIRVYDVADPLHPAPLVTAVAPAFASSIAYSAGKVYVLAGKVFGYAEATLTQVEERLTAVTPAATQRIRIDGTCALVARDTEAPTLYNLPSWTAATQQFSLPSNLRAFAVHPGMLLFLTDHSLELAYPTPAGDPPRRRAVH
ncbi:MAG TPA: hypothetical protein VF215_01060 [Thermoanaerobaculia bacterium]